MFHALDSWDPAPLRRALVRGAYTQASLKQFGLAGTAYQGRAAALFRESLPSGSALKALARLFLLGDTVPAADLLGTLGADIGSLADLGLLTFAAGQVSSSVSLVPYGDGWFASDFMRQHTATPADYVMGLGPTTRLLVSLAPKHRASSVLDLGCGAGWLATQLQRIGISATGTDISPRAIALARFNAKLAGLSGIEWHQGSWFEPLAERRFDLICSNPPYAQSPGGPLTFRETAPGTEPPCAHILRHAAAHLNPGGIACILLNWSHHGSDNWAQAPLEWAPAAGVRRWLFQLEALSPVDYAWRWLRPDPRFATADAARAELDRWLAHYATVGTTAISSGFIVLQHCAAGQEWTRTDSRVTGEIPPTASEEVMRVLTNETWLRSEPADLDLLARRYLVPDGIQAEINTSLGDHGWQQRAIRLTSPGKLSYDGQIDENLLRLLELCRNDQRPADMVAELRAKLQFDGIPDLDARIAALTRELLRFALITPA
jgi:methylase of polypeptide subunit release factors